jgi:hypothetical protein
MRQGISWDKRRKREKKSPNGRRAIKLGIVTFNKGILPFQYAGKSIRII